MKAIIYLMATFVALGLGPLTAAAQGRPDGAPYTRTLPVHRPSPEEQVRAAQLQMERDRQLSSRRQDQRQVELDAATCRKLLAAGKPITGRGAEACSRHIEGWVGLRKADAATHNESARKAAEGPGSAGGKHQATMARARKKSAKLAVTIKRWNLACRHAPQQPQCKRVSHLHKKYKEVEQRLALIDGASAFGEGLDAFREEEEVNALIAGLDVIAGELGAGALAQRIMAGRTTRTRGNKLLEKILTRPAGAELPSPTPLGEFADD